MRPCLLQNLFVMYRWFGVVPQCLDGLFPFVLFGDFRSPIWWISWSVFGTFLLGIWWGMYVWTLRGSFPCDSPPKSVRKGARIWGFRCSRLEEFLVGFLRFPLIWQVLVDINFAMDSAWGVPTIPKVLRKSVERFGRSGVGFGGVDPRVLFILTSSGHIGLTGASRRSDRCKPLFGFARVNIWVSSLLSRVVVVSSLGHFGAR
jgi:hypothetical protein